MSNDRHTALTLVTPPASEPITLSQAKTFLRMEHTAEDATVALAITTARQYAEQYLRTVLLPQTWEYHAANPACAVVSLPIGPAMSVVSVTQTGEAGNSSVMEAVNYHLSVDGRQVHFTTAQTIEKLTVRFVAGAYAAVTAIPAPLIQGMLYHCAAMLEQRDGQTGIPMQSVNLYAAFRRVGV